MRRLLYLGFAFPPGVQALYPAINPAGHGFETQMVAALREHFEIRSSGTLPIIPPAKVLAAEASPGVAHELFLLEKAPELFHRLKSLSRLKAEYRRWAAEGWVPDAVLVYNLSPIYNSFIRWLKRNPPHPKLILLLLDSSNLGGTMPAFKRFRHRFKPMTVTDDEMIGNFDACVGLSRSAERFFTARKTPFLWMPGGCTPQRAIAEVETKVNGGRPICFGYFGALAPHAGVMPLVETFLASRVPGVLHICGHGKLGEQIAKLAESNPRLKYGGLLATPEDCLKFAQDFDVLVNARPASYGNENNFPSKVFEYALAGRAILTSRLAGVETVLGAEAFYFEPENFPAGLQEQLEKLAEVPREELRRRGKALRERITGEYSWSRQAAKMAEFIGGTG